MRIEAKSCPVRVEFRRADTSEAVRWIRWYDTESHEYEAFAADPDAFQQKHAAMPRQLVQQGLRRLVVRGRQQLLTNPPLEQLLAILAQAKAAFAPKPSTPLGEIRREILRGQTVRTIQLDPNGDPPECDEPKCHRKAEYVVVEREQHVEPAVFQSSSFERAVMLGAKAYCAWHYRAPVQISVRGVESEISVKVRPQ